MQLNQNRAASKTLLIAGAVALMLALSAQPGKSWDAGPMKPKNCMHDVCSGGVTMGQMIVGKEATNIPLRGNTHLWIVRNALELLDKGPAADTETKKIYAALTAPACQSKWEEALFMADEPPLAETAGAYGTHFYNAAGRDFTGAKTDIERYTGSSILKIRNLAPSNANSAIGELGNARDNAYKNLEDMELKLHTAAGAKGALDVRTTTLAHEAVACTDLGYALHYLTDMTQPMHSGSFAAVQKSKTGQMSPIAGRALHAVYEYWAPTIQAKFPVNPAKPVTFQPANIAIATTLKADDIFLNTALYFNGEGPELYKLLTSSRPGVPECQINAMTGSIASAEGKREGEDPVDYRGPCFVKDPLLLTKVTGDILEHAYVATASYIFAAINNGPGKEPK